jgi:hypothetical protein
MKKLRISLLVASIVLILVFLGGNYANAWDEACFDDSCVKIMDKYCNILCRGYDGCFGWSYSGDCVHGICQIYATFRCESGHEEDLIVLCVGAPCPQ